MRNETSETLRHENNRIVKNIKDKARAKRGFRALLGVVMMAFMFLLLPLSSVNAEIMHEATRFELYPTENIYTFLKLDTTNGMVDQIQWGESSGYRVMMSINKTPLANGEIGRFRLYPTENILNFILLDTQNGDCYQVQWSREKEHRFIAKLEKLN